jgi:hypothetical protein
MLDELITSTPYPTDYFNQIFANIRAVKNLFQERYELDHKINTTDTALTDGHNRLTFKTITINMYADQTPYPMNWTTGVAEIPYQAGILFCKTVGTSVKLCYAVKDKNNALKEIIIR